MTTPDNVGKCGHAKCAGGTGEHCFYKGKPMSAYTPVTNYTQKLDPDHVHNFIDGECIGENCYATQNH